VRSYHAVEIRAFSRVRFFILASFSAFTESSNQHSQSQVPKTARYRGTGKANVYIKFIKKLEALA
jgi:hypothetical protein